MSDFPTPFRFLAALLSGPPDGRRKLYRRLGREARDPIDELLGQALAFERREAPSLLGFLAHIAASTTEIKRQSEARSDVVRVMTVHGSKGLQAPIVILADATRSEEHTSELQSLMRISYAVFCLKKKKNHKHNPNP